MWVFHLFHPSYCLPVNWCTNRLLLKTSFCHRFRFYWKAAENCYVECLSYYISPLQTAAALWPHREVTSPDVASLSSESLNLSSRSSSVYMGDSESDNGRNLPSTSHQTQCKPADDVRSPRNLVVRLYRSNLQRDLQLRLCVPLTNFQRAVNRWINLLLGKSDKTNFVCFVLLVYLQTASRQTGRRIQLTSAGNEVNLAFASHRVGQDEWFKHIVIDKQVSKWTFWEHWWRIFLDFHIKILFQTQSI